MYLYKPRLHETEPRPQRPHRHVVTVWRLAPLLSRAKVWNGLLWRLVIRPPTPQTRVMSHACSQRPNGLGVCLSPDVWALHARGRPGSGWGVPCYGLGAARREYSPRDFLGTVPTGTHRTPPHIPTGDGASTMGFPFYPCAGQGRRAGAGPVPLPSARYRRVTKDHPVVLAQHSTERT